MASTASTSSSRTRRASRINSRSRSTTSACDSISARAAGAGLRRRRRETATNRCAPRRCSTVAEKLDEIGNRDQDRLRREPAIRAGSPERGPQTGACQRIRRRRADEGGPARRSPSRSSSARRPRAKRSFALGCAAEVSCRLLRASRSVVRTRLRDRAIRQAAAGSSSARPASAAEEPGCAKKILSSLARRAYRRPVTDADLQPLLSIYEAERGEGGFEAGIQQALERILVSPQFLFRIERAARRRSRRAPCIESAISSWPRGCRFSCGAASPTMSCSTLAARGKLRDRTVLEQQVRRMLRDPRSEALATNFAAQWLYLRDVDAKTPSPRLFPDFDLSLRDAFERETEPVSGERLPRGSQRARSAQRERHVHERTPRQTLRDAERFREQLPPRHVRRQTIRGAGSGCSGTAAS